MPDRSIVQLLHTLNAHEKRARNSLNFTPSENTMSPLARLPMVLDTYSRYFFDHMSLFNEWLFFGGIEAGRIELDILKPLLQEMAGAQFVDVRPISGLNCMTIAMAGLCPSGGTMLTVPEESGGHMSTTHVAERLGIRTLPIPMAGTHYVDLPALEGLLAQSRPDLVYLDQSSQLFPVDPYPVRQLIDAVSPGTVLHLDSSHTNGLILGGALPNPLKRGAHTFGGSTHKTLPGPHKGFLATNDERLRDRIDAIAYHYVSHHHLGAVVSLAITLLELRDCNGEDYAHRVMANARRFARALWERGIPVAEPDLDFTACHQVWVKPVTHTDATKTARLLEENGLLVNKLTGLPGIPGPAFRLSLAEATRLGAKDGEVDDLARVFADLLTDNTRDRHEDVLELRQRLSRPRYCYDYEDLRAMGAPADLLHLFSTVIDTVSHR